MLGERRARVGSVNALMADRGTALWAPRADNDFLDIPDPPALPPNLISFEQIPHHTQPDRGQRSVNCKMLPVRHLSADTGSFTFADSCQHKEHFGLVLATLR